MFDKDTPWSKRAPFDLESITCGRCDSETSFEMDGRIYNVFFDDDDDFNDD